MTEYREEKNQLNEKWLSNREWWGKVEKKDKKEQEEKFYALVEFRNKSVQDLIDEGVLDPSDREGFEDSICKLWFTMSQEEKDQLRRKTKQELTNEEWVVRRWIIRDLQYDTTEEEINRIKGYPEDIKERLELLEEAGITGERADKLNKKYLNAANWIQIERDYVFGIVKKDEKGINQLWYPTLKEVANKYGVSEQACKEHSRKEDWTRKRQLFLRKNRLNILRQNVNELSQESIGKDNKLLQRLEKLDDIIDLQISNIEQASIEGEIIKIKEMEGLISLLDRKSQLEKRLYGEPTNLADLEREILLTRLKNNESVKAYRKKKEIDYEFENKEMQKGVIEIETHISKDENIQDLVSLLDNRKKEKQIKQDKEAAD